MIETKWPYNFDVTLFLTSFDNYFLDAREQRIIMGREIWLSFWFLQNHPYECPSVSQFQTIPSPHFHCSAAKLQSTVQG